MSTSTRTRSWVLILGLLAAGCGEPAANGQGAALLASPPAVVTLEHVMAVGDEATTTDPEHLFYRPVALKFNESGQFAVLDMGNNRVQIHDSEGNVVRSVGSSGGGPGQLNAPTGLWFYPDGRIIVADSKHRRLQPFDANGRFETAIRLEFPPLDVLAIGERLFVAKTPISSRLPSDVARGLVVEVDPATGAVLNGFLDPLPHENPVLFMVRNAMKLAVADGEILVGKGFVSSQMLAFDADGDNVARRNLAYEGGDHAPLDFLPDEIDMRGADDQLEPIARVVEDLAWDSMRRMTWVLAGYGPRAGDESGRILHVYDEAGALVGRGELPFSASSIGIGPDGKFWAFDSEYTLHAFQPSFVGAESAPAGHAAEYEPAAEPENMTVSTRQIGDFVDPLFVDARSAPEGFVVEGAVHLRPDASLPLVLRLPKTSPLLVYCACEGDRSSLVLVHRLRRYGYDAHAIEGGIDALYAAGVAVID